MSAFASAISSAFNTLKSAAGAAVTYSRGNASVSLTAVPGHTDFGANPDFGIVEQFTSHDWIIAASDLVLSGVVVVPESGDKVVRITGSTRQTFQVMTPPYKPSDHDQTRIRIHTKLVKTESI